LGEVVSVAILIECECGFRINYLWKWVD